MIRSSSLNPTRACKRKTLLRTGIGLHFRHRIKYFVKRSAKIVFFIRNRNVFLESTLILLRQTAQLNFIRSKRTFIAKNPLINSKNTPIFVN